MKGFMIERGENAAIECAEGKKVPFISTTKANSLTSYLNSGCCSVLHVTCDMTDNSIKQAIKMFLFSNAEKNTLHSR